MPGPVAPYDPRHLRSRLLLPLLDLRQVALGDSGEPSKRVPRYVREFSLGAQVPAGVGQLAGELGHDGSTGSVAIGVGYAQRHRAGGRKGAHLPGAWVNRSAMTHSAAGWLPMPKWLA